MSTIKTNKTNKRPASARQYVVVATCKTGDNAGLTGIYAQGANARFGGRLATYADDFAGVFYFFLRRGGAYGGQDWRRHFARLYNTRQEAQAAGVCFGDNSARLRIMTALDAGRLCRQQATKVVGDIPRFWIKKTGCNTPNMLNRAGQRGQITTGALCALLAFAGCLIGLFSGQGEILALPFMMGVACLAGGITRAPRRYMVRGFDSTRARALITYGVYSTRAAAEERHTEVVRNNPMAAVSIHATNPRQVVKQGIPQKISRPQDFKRDFCRRYYHARLLWKRQKRNHAGDVLFVPLQANDRGNGAGWVTFDIGKQTTAATAWDYWVRAGMQTKDASVCARALDMWVIHQKAPNEPPEQPMKFFDFTHQDAERVAAALATKGVRFHFYAPQK